MLYAGVRQKEGSFMDELYSASGADDTVRFWDRERGVRDQNRTH